MLLQQQVPSPLLNSTPAPRNFPLHFLTSPHVHNITFSRHFSRHRPLDTGHAQCVTALLDASCDADARDVKGWRWTPSNRTAFWLMCTFRIYPFATRHQIRPHRSPFSFTNFQPKTPTNSTVCALLLTPPPSDPAFLNGRRDDVESQIARCASLSPAARAIAPLLQVTFDMRCMTCDV
jgi:hypothetical protein